MTQIAQGKLIKANGDEKIVYANNGTDFSLEEMQRFVGGYIQIIYLNDGLIMVINEEGKLENLPRNDKATKIASSFIPMYDWIVGDVVVCNSEYLK